MVSAVAPVSPSARASELSPAGIRADALTIATLYGFAPAFFVANTTTVIYQAVNAAPHSVTEIARIARTKAIGDRSSPFFDRYA